MYKLRVEADFSAAHSLTHYHGKCERLHGHNYRVRLWARGEELDEGGMLIDFGDLKSALREVLSGLDHSFLNEMDVFHGDPSAERLAHYIFDATVKILGDRGIDTAAIWAVDVFETPRNMATWERA